MLYSWNGSGSRKPFPFRVDPLFYLSSFEPLLLKSPQFLVNCGLFYVFIKARHGFMDLRIYRRKIQRSLTEDISMYSSNILHLIQNPVNSAFPFPDYPGNNDLRSIVFTMKCISKDNRKERSHFIVNIRILRFPGFR